MILMKQKVLSHEWVQQNLLQKSVHLNGKLSYSDIPHLNLFAMRVNLSTTSNYHWL